MSIRSKNLLVAVLATLASLLLAEMVLRWIAPPVQLGLGFDDPRKSARYGWSHGTGLIRQVNPDTGERFEFTTNSQGWKDVEHPLRKPDGVFRIVVLGDSHTYGAVPLEQLYTRRLEAILRERGHKAVEVLSFAMGGWGADQRLEALQAEALAYRPDVVIYQFCGNDVGDNFSRGPGDGKPFLYHLLDGRLERVAFSTNEETTGWLRARHWLVQHSALAFNLALVWKQLTTDSERKGTENRTKTALNDNASLEDRDTSTGPRPGSYFERHANADPLTRRIARVVDRKLRRDPALRTPAIEQMVQYFRVSSPVRGSPYFVYSPGELTEPERKGWALQSALMERMRDLSAQTNARMVCFSEAADAGAEQWLRDWTILMTDDRGDYVENGGRRVAVDAMRPAKEFARICDALDIPLVENRRVYERFEFDSHANRVGNENMALDIADALEEMSLPTR
ncbi:MAG: SGNH/GDSL hydrolase family protein [Chromatiales bacterium]|nr:SGNH/GDSL hydrolase family protein [Chromatiales bacterium]